MPYTDNDGVKIYYETEGSGPPLLLHVGFADKLQDWRRPDVALAQALRDDYTLLLLDPRGQGASDKPHDSAAYTLDHRVGDVLAVLDAEGIDRAHYWGYSMGGQIGYAMALQDPQRLHSLILGGTTPFPFDAAEQHRVAALLRRGADDFITDWEEKYGAMPDHVRAQWQAVDAQALAACREALAAQPDLSPGLVGINFPTLLYVGGNDVHVEATARAAALIPGATHVLVPGLNHGEMFRATEAILPQARAFLERIR